MRPEHVEDVLVQLHSGQWFGWDDKDKVYANLVIHTSDDKPTQAWLESELASKQAAWDAAQTADAENKSSAKSKLTALGLSEDEISAAFGI
jgi:hypothetical protein|tara:strand:+ start:468 stop:740 length:273 start_codon:yes stop_codon:yes gene_type:complete